jgi:K+-transporting ATPase ATPase C chain
LIEKDGKVIGSALIGQEFKDDKYFHGRPSAPGARSERFDQDGAGTL